MYDRPTTQDTLAHWQKLHGEDYIIHDGYYIFPDGSVLGIDQPFGKSSNRPNTPEGYRERKAYLRLRAQQLRERYEEERQRAIEAATIAAKGGHDLGFDVEEVKAKIKTLREQADQAEIEYREFTEKERAPQQRIAAFEAEMKRKNSEQAKLVLKDLKRL